MSLSFFSSVTWSQPWFFLLFLLLPLLWLRREKIPLLLILWRSVVLSLVVLALTRPKIVLPVGKTNARVFAFDLSRSVPIEMRRWMVQSARESFAPEKGDRAFVFGGRTIKIRDWESAVGAETENAQVEPGQTNLAELFTSVLRLQRPPVSVVLYTDGWENRGSVRSMLPTLARSGVRVYPVVPPEPVKIQNVSVRKILTPHRAAQGESVHLRVGVENQGATPVAGELLLYRDDEILSRKPTTIEPGSHIFDHRVILPRGPLALFRARFVAGDRNADLVAEDNEATASVSVNAKERVLLFNGRAGEEKYLTEILKRLGFEFFLVGPDAPLPPPAEYRTVIFNNVARERFSAGYLNALEKHVAAGAGFLMLGGENSFAPGGYRGTPISSLLPVELIEVGKQESLRAVVLLIDKSGSMRDGKRLLYAQEAAKAVGRQLGDRDLLGVIGFDVSPFVVVPLAPVADSRSGLTRDIDRLKPGGKTYLYPAMVEAKEQLAKVAAARKHLIILSDGETGGRGSDYIDLVSQMQEEFKIAVSTVAIGEEANLPLLKRISQYGGGFFHHTYDAGSLPELLARQVERPEGETPQREREFPVTILNRSQALAGFELQALPAIHGYSPTEPKKSAVTAAVVSDKEKRAPLVASWRYGKGKAVAFTSDFHGLWSKRWIVWEGADQFWRSLFHWLSPPSESLPPFAARVDLKGGQPVLDFYIFDPESDGNPVRYSYAGTGGTGEGYLDRLTAGHYQGRLPLAAPGEYRIRLVNETPGKNIPYPPIVYTLPFNPDGENHGREFNLELIHRLARETGGRVNAVGQPSAMKPVAVTTLDQAAGKSITGVLVLVAMIFFIGEIYFRWFFKYL
jgi:uncharacterized membrane protein